MLVGDLDGHIPGLQTVSWFAPLSLVAALVGCASSALPPSLSQAEHRLVNSTHYAATVGVAPYKYPVYSERLLKSLRGTGLFDDVEALERIENPDLIASVERPVHGSAVFPLWTFLTGGLVPTIVDEQWGEVFSLRPSRGSVPGATIDFSYSGGTHLGWVALVTGLAPARTLVPPPWTRRFIDALSLAICGHAPEIEKMIRESRDR